MTRVLKCNLMTYHVTIYEKSLMFGSMKKSRESIFRTIREIFKRYSLLSVLETRLQKVNNEIACSILFFSIAYKNCMGLYSVHCYTFGQSSVKFLRTPWAQSLKNTSIESLTDFTLNWLKAEVKDAILRGWGVGSAREPLARAGDASLFK